jgi:hypothetical protein
MGTVNNWFRDREAPYTELVMNSWRVYFIHAQPGEWMRNPSSREAFVVIYGPDAIEDLDKHGFVPENTEKFFVAGNQDRPTWFDPDVPQPLTPGPDEMWVNTQLGPMIVKKPVGTVTAPADLGPIVEALTRIEGKINALLLR